tara:strand:- start:840 stop:1301 length:462 start_codon:yes stop_codon:yes gene_type:complete
MNLKQFKLTNGDEIICEVIEDAANEGSLVIRKALKINSAEDYENNVRYYSFRPLVSFQDNFDELVIVNVGHIITESLPSKTLVMHYSGAVKEVERTQEGKGEFNLDEIIADIQDMTEQEVQEYIKYQLREQQEFVGDSSTSNVIKFNPKSTFH